MTAQLKRNALLAALSALEAANKDLAAAKRALEIAEMRAGQEGPSLLAGGGRCGGDRLIGATSAPPDED